MPMTMFTPLYLNGVPKYIMQRPNFSAKLSESSRRIYIWVAAASAKSPTLAMKASNACFHGDPMLAKHGI